MESEPIEPSPHLLESVHRTVENAADYAWRIRKDDCHWIGELKSNVAITAQQIFLLQSLGEKVSDVAAYRRYLLSEQLPDGSWTIAPGHLGDISISTEAYLALKILGVPPDNQAMLSAKEFIRGSGGVARVRIFTRIFLAQFGLFPWNAVPQLPAEFILLPSILPLNIYRLASWARSTVIPLLIIRHHQAIYALPNGRHAHNTFLDELWLDSSNKNVPYRSMSWDCGAIAIFFSLLDLFLALLGRIRPLWIFRGLSRWLCIRWILQHQEEEGDWAGIIPPMHAGVQALLLEGYDRRDDCICRAIEAIERFTWQDDQGKRLQSCISPVWDTVLMVRGLVDVGVDKSDERLRETVKWIKSKQILEETGDWRIFAKSIKSGGYSFEYNNRWYPDVDDTAAAILAIITHDPVAVGSTTVSRAAHWICGMQNRDGGWAAFDINNDKLWLNKIPFSDMDSLCDPSSADVTGRILEAFGLMIRLAETEFVESVLIEKLSIACSRAIEYLSLQQNACGPWYGRWGCNYIYGTSNVVCGLSYFSAGNDQVCEMLIDAIKWIKQMQNADGGWGESLQSYRDLSKAGRGPSSPSQTAWALMALLTRCGPDDQSITAGVSHLVDTQTDRHDVGASWPESTFTGTGFPNHFYIGYSLYRHYFPMMALGRFLKVSEECRASANGSPKGSRSRHDSLQSVS
ncbi:terpene cyclase [Curvularia kusanoi]|uniref:Terpene cyclase/mutase family member n=1 Tax=Curvularia kusanoi TaxID=90978 RepID=A0A9P4TFV0_CURKU|nr:terpene cyclase [Curvularia kusanoi]